VQDVAKDLAEDVPQDVAQDLWPSGPGRCASSSPRHRRRQRRLCAARAEMGAQLGSSVAFGSGCGQALPGVPRKAPLCLWREQRPAFSNLMPTIGKMCASHTLSVAFLTAGRRAHCYGSRDLNIFVVGPLNRIPVSIKQPEDPKLDSALRFPANCGECGRETTHWNGSSIFCCGLRFNAKTTLFVILLRITPPALSWPSPDSAPPPLAETLPWAAKAVGGGAIKSTTIFSSDDLGSSSTTVICAKAASRTTPPTPNKTNPHC